MYTNLQSLRNDLKSTTDTRVALTAYKIKHTEAENAVFLAWNKIR